MADFLEKNLGVSSSNANKFTKLNDVTDEFTLIEHKNKRSNKRRSDISSDSKTTKLAKNNDKKNSQDSSPSLLNSKVNSNGNDENKRIYSQAEILTFDKDNSGPFGIWIKNIDYNKEINCYEVGSFIYKEFKNATIARKNKFNVEVVFDYRSDANRFLSLAEKLKKERGLNMFIPGHRRTRKGIIKYIPQYITEEQIYDSCSASTEFHIINVKRMTVLNRNRTSDDEDKYIPSDKIIITFAGQEFPKNFRVCLVKTEIFPYVQRPMQCYNCLKFGHIASKCKSPKICKDCGKENHLNSSECCSEKLCVNCQGSHSSLDKKNCPEYAKQMKITTIMAYDNLSFLEARKLVIDPKDHQTQSITKENFPALINNKKNEYYNKKEDKDSNYNSSTPTTKKTYSRSTKSMAPKVSNYNGNKSNSDIVSPTLNLSPQTTSKETLTPASASAPASASGPVSSPASYALSITEKLAQRFNIDIVSQSMDGDFRIDNLPEDSSPL